MLVFFCGRILNEIIVHIVTQIFLFFVGSNHNIFYGMIIRQIVDVAFINYL